MFSQCVESRRNKLEHTLFSLLLRFRVRTATMCYLLLSAIDNMLTGIYSRYPYNKNKNECLLTNHFMPVVSLHILFYDIPNSLIR